jgi:hypothetical protein
MQGIGHRFVGCDKVCRIQGLAWLGLARLILLGLREVVRMGSHSIVQKGSQTKFESMTK